MMNSTQFLVRKDHINTTQLRTADNAPLAKDQVRVRIDSFALTSNNITYAAMGDKMDYWQFFPVDAAAGEGWGQIPVWGFGSVVESLHEDVKVGERLYGYYPMATNAVLQPDSVTADGFRDGAPHRAALHAVYNNYARTRTDPFYTAKSEDIQSLLRPLFITSWLIDDFIADNNFFGANAIGDDRGVMLLSSASSKTAYGTAFQLAQRQGIEVVGLTSASNVAFCESLSVYHHVLSYEQLDQIAADMRCVYIDFAGNAELRRAIHTRFTHLKYSCAIGLTHVDQGGGSIDQSKNAAKLPGPKAELFFAPAQVKKRVTEWGAAEFGQKMVHAWKAFTQRATTTTGNSPAWLTVEHHNGPQAVEAAYAQVLAGRGDPRVGHILSLSPVSG